MVAGAGVLVILCVIAVVFFALVGGLFSMGGSAPRAVVQSDYAMVENAAPMPMTKSMAVLGEGAGAINVPQREGVLPVRLELPRLGKTITVTNHLVTKENPVKLSIVLASNWLAWVLYAIALLAGYLAYRGYRR